jgi:hypothetical protein
MCHLSHGQDQGVVIVRTCAGWLDGCGVAGSARRWWPGSRRGPRPHRGRRSGCPGERQAADGEVVGEEVGQDDGVDGALPVGEPDLGASGTGRASSDARSGGKVTASRPAVAPVLAVGYPHYGSDPGSSTGDPAPASSTIGSAPHGSPGGSAMVAGSALLIEQAAMDAADLTRTRKPPATASFVKHPPVAAGGCRRQRGSQNS